MPNVLALAFHVDYWDSIGWRDRFELPVAAARQSRYVDALQLSTAFTPQVVIDGRSSWVGSDRRSIQRGLATAPAGIPIGLIAESVDLVITLPEEPNRAEYDIDVIAILPQATTAVGRGENTGRNLMEFNVVRQFRRIGSWDGKARALRVPLKSFPADARLVAVLLQRSGQGTIDGSASIGLPVPAGNNLLR